MKTRILFILLCGSLSLFSCKKDSIDILGGTQAKNGGVGVTVTATTTTTGVSSITGSVKTLQDGISTFSGTAVVTNSTIKNVLTNVPGMVINGNNVSTSSVKFKLTSEGIESIAPLDPGVIVNFNSRAGDTYTGSTGAKRTVASVSTTDDFLWSGMYIKVYKIEESPNKLGIKKITYWANHNFGLVSIEFTFDDNSVSRFPISMSTNI
jgi:hypothetical protein